MRHDLFWDQHPGHEEHHPDRKPLELLALDTLGLEETYHKGGGGQDEKADHE